MPTPADSSTTGSSDSVSMANSPNGGDTCSVLPTATLSWIQFDTSPAGVAAPASSRLTEMRMLPSRAASDRLYWRNWVRPSPNCTVTLTYWPALNGGSGAPSAATKRIDLIVGALLRHFGHPHRAGLARLDAGFARTSLFRPG